MSYDHVAASYFEEKQEEIAATITRACGVGRDFPEALMEASHYFNGWDKCCVLTSWVGT